MGARALPFGLVVAVILAGCGGGGGSSSTTSAADWANAYCSAAATWVASFQSARESLKNNNGSTGPQSAVQSVSLATNTFVIALGRLGKPDTANGDAAQEAAKQLGDNVQGHVARASAAVQTNNENVTPAQQAVVVRKQATEAIAALADTTNQLEQDDPELADAMKTSSDCATLKADLAKETAG